MTKPSLRSISILFLSIFIHSFYSKANSYSNSQQSFKKTSSKFFAVLSHKLDGGIFLLDNGRLNFQLNEKHQDSDDLLDFKIYNQNHTVVLSNQSLSGSLKVHSSFGNNLYSLNLYDCDLTPSGYLPSGVYLLEVLTAKKEKFYLRFENKVLPKSC